MSINGVHFYDDLDVGDRGVLMYLEQEGYVYTKALDPPIYLITQKGLAKLKEIEDKAKQEAKDEGQRRFQNKISVAQMLVPLITFILGLVVEHYSGLVSALSEFLGRWIK